MKLQILGLLLGAVLLVGCQSARVPALLPVVQEYGRQPVSQVVPPAAVAATEPPQLLADASAATSAPELPHRLRPVIQPLQITPVDVPLPRPAATPDTTRTRTDPQASKPDPETTTVNLIGGALSLTGIVGTLVAFNSEFSSGWTNIALLLVAVTLFPVGIALLLYQGENGRLRLRRQARREARRAAKNPAGSELKPDAPPVKKKSRLGKIGVILLLAGAALLTGAYLLGGFALLFFGLPGLILGISGLIAVVAAL